MSPTFLNLVGQQGQPSGAGGSLFIGLFMAMAVFYLVWFLGERRKRKEREQKMGSLAKNDKVMTVGGIIGTIVQVRDNEIVLKVDESTNTKIRFLRSAIQQVLTDDDAADKP